MVQRLACLLFIEYRSKYPCSSSDGIANIICNSGLLGVDLRHVKKTVKKTVNKMITLGSYYRNMEQALGKGVALSLGTDISETTWTRVLTKKPEKVNVVMSHLKETLLAELSQKYARLRDCLINHRMDRFAEEMAISARMLAEDYAPAVSCFIMGTNSQSSEQDMCDLEMFEFIEFESTH